MSDFHLHSWGISGPYTISDRNYNERIEFQRVSLGGYKQGILWQIVDTTNDVQTVLNNPTAPKIVSSNSNKPKLSKGSGAYKDNEG